MPRTTVPERFRVLSQAGTPGKTRNGGSYDFWTTFTRAEAGDYEVRYRTSADFEYCSVCGAFQSCSACGCYDCDVQQCALPPIFISTEEAAALYAHAVSHGVLMAD
jgi:hypothetical protein